MAVGRRQRDVDHARAAVEGDDLDAGQVLLQRDLDADHAVAGVPPHVGGRLAGDDAGLGRAALGEAELAGQPDRRAADRAGGVDAVDPVPLGPGAHGLHVSVPTW